MKPNTPALLSRITDSDCLLWNRIDNNRERIWRQRNDRSKWKLDVEDQWLWSFYVFGTTCHSLASWVYYLCSNLVFQQNSSSGFYHRRYIHISRSLLTIYLLKVRVFHIALNTMQINFNYLRQNCWFRETRLIIYVDWRSASLIKLLMISRISAKRVKFKELSLVSLFGSHWHSTTVTICRVVWFLSPSCAITEDWQ